MKSVLKNVVQRDLDGSFSEPATQLIPIVRQLILGAFFSVRENKK